MPTRVGLSMCLLLGATIPAGANIRARIDDPGGRSSALHGAIPGVTVLREDLRFDCHGKPSLDRQERCHVEAKYVVTAEKQTVLAAEFILPVRADIVARVGPGPALAVSAEELPPAQPVRGYAERHVFRAAFKATLVPGENEITVSYDQDAGTYESEGPSYFRSSRFISVIGYELWPLKEWQRAQTFQLHVALEVDGKRSHWWNRAATHHHATCIGVDKQEGTIPLTGMRETQHDDRLLLELDLPTSFPDRLRCGHGEARDLDQIVHAGGS